MCKANPSATLGAPAHMHIKVNSEPKWVLHVAMVVFILKYVCTTMIRYMVQNVSKAVCDGLAHMVWPRAQKLGIEWVAF